MDKTNPFEPVQAASFNASVGEEQSTQKVPIPLGLKALKGVSAVSKIVGSGLSMPAQVISAGVAFTAAGMVGVGASLYKAFGKECEPKEIAKKAFDVVLKGSMAFTSLAAATVGITQASLLLGIVATEIDHHLEHEKGGIVKPFLSQDGRKYPEFANANLLAAKLLSMEGSALFKMPKMPPIPRPKLPSFSPSRAHQTVFRTVGSSSTNTQEAPSILSAEEKQGLLKRLKDKREGFNEGDNDYTKFGKRAFDYEIRGPIISGLERFLKSIANQIDVDDLIKELREQGPDNFQGFNEFFDKIEARINSTTNKPIAKEPSSGTERRKTTQVASDKIAPPERSPAAVVPMTQEAAVKELRNIQEQDYDGKPLKVFLLISDAFGHQVANEFGKAFQRKNPEEINSFINEEIKRLTRGPSPSSSPSVSAVGETVLKREQSANVNEPTTKENYNEVTEKNALPGSVSRNSSFSTSSSSMQNLRQSSSTSSSSAQQSPISSSSASTSPETQKLLDELEGLRNVIKNNYGESFTNSAGVTIANPMVVAIIRQRLEALLKIINGGEELQKELKNCATWKSLEELCGKIKELIIKNDSSSSGNPSVSVQKVREDVLQSAADANIVAEKKENYKSEKNPLPGSQDDSIKSALGTVGDELEQFYSARDPQKLREKIASSSTASKAASSAKADTEALGKLEEIREQINNLSADKLTIRDTLLINRDLRILLTKTGASSNLKNIKTRDGLLALCAKIECQIQLRVIRKKLEDASTIPSSGNAVEALVRLGIYSDLHKLGEKMGAKGLTDKLEESNAPQQKYQTKEQFALLFDEFQKEINAKKIT